MPGKLDHALKLAAMGFWLFPIASGKKAPPAINNWQDLATRKAETLQHWFGTLDYNLGISTSRFGDDEALVVIDVDNKGVKNGDESLLRLELDGCDTPRTFSQRTPSGGRHLVFRVREPLRQGVDVLGPGLDIRSQGGYIVAAGSTVEAGEYTCDDTEVAPAPQWLVDRLGKPRERTVAAAAVPGLVDPNAAKERVIHYLTHEAPLSVEGEGGDQTAFVVAARCKDLGAGVDHCVVLMDQHWNDRCSPPWPLEELRIKVHNAFAYGQQPPGAAAPEVQFPPVEQPAGKPEAQHPVDKLNNCYAWVCAGGGDHILFETTDPQGRFALEHLNVSTFHRKHASQKIRFGKRDEPVTEVWMASKTRRSYDGFVFDPSEREHTRHYNLWRGFAVQPQAEGEAEPLHAKRAVEDFISHAKENVCRGDEALFHWLMGYFAHLVQRPWEKPLVALVFRGGKGVGKNALVERVGALLGNHFLVTAERRYLVGNFNGHLENLLLFALDEAFWSGDKQAEGIIKSIITSPWHVIEHKGKEPFRVENKTRVVIIGNEDWLVPASHDERRFAVFDVGDGRKQDRAFFHGMREGMESGGYRLLLRYLLDYPISDVDVNAAPNTQALLDQKHASLTPLEQWWLDCLMEARILGADFDAGFDGHVERDRLRAAFSKYSRDRRVTQRVPDARSIGRELKKFCPSIMPSKQRSGQEFVSTYKLPDVAEARRLWGQHVGQKVEWE